MGLGNLDGRRSGCIMEMDDCAAIHVDTKS